MVISVHCDLLLAYKDLNEQKDKIFRKFLESDSIGELVLPQKMKACCEIRQELRIFVCKLLIVCVLLGGTVLWAGITVINKVTNISGAAVFKKMAKEAVDEIDHLSQLAPERKKEMINKLKMIVAEIKPILDEIQALPGPVNSSGAVKLRK